MRKLRTLLTTALALFIALAMVTPAFAEGTHNVIITSQDSANHTYGAYQIFTGTYTGGKLNNVGWGANLDPATEVDDKTFVQALKADETLKQVSAIAGLADSASAEDVATALKDVADDSTQAQAFAALADKYLTGEPAGTAQTSNKVATITGLEDGYYLVKDTADVNPTTGTPTRFVIGAIGAEGTNCEIQAKNSDVPTIEKKVQDKNDTTGETEGPQDSADYDIGDKVPFTLTGTVPAGATNYTEYYYAIQDVMSKGLTLDEGSVVVKANGTMLAKGTDYTLEINPTLDDTAYPDADNNTSFQVVLKDAKAYAGQTITVEYKATLNDQAAVGKVGNPNKARIEYSNNPNTNDHGKTEWDHVIVFTYKTVVNKTDGTNPLPGADFKLEKEVKQDDGTTKWVEVSTKTITDKTTFTFTGLDDGNYRITETTTPDGYSKIDPITFTIKAEHVTGFTGLDWKTGKSDDGKTVLTSVDFGTLQHPSSDPVGTATTEVVNKSGFTLPKTGDMGTTILYVAGGLLALGAAIVLVSKRIAKSQN